MKNNKRFEHVYPIIRIGLFQFQNYDRAPTGNEVATFIKVVSVFNDENQAEAEVERLNGLNPEGDVLYVYDISRFKV